jgi:hypothetical protein
VEVDCGTGSGGGLAGGDVGDGSRAGEDADAHVLAAAEAGNGLGDVVSAGNLENVGAHGGLRVAGDEDWRLGLVLGSRWAAPRPPNHLDGGSISAFRGESGLLGLARRRGGVNGSTAASAAVLIFRGLLLAFTWCGRDEKMGGGVVGVGVGGADVVEDAGVGGEAWRTCWKLHSLALHIHLSCWKFPSLYSSLYIVRYLLVAL